MVSQVTSFTPTIEGIKGNEKMRELGRCCVFISNTQGNNLENSVFITSNLILLHITFSVFCPIAVFYATVLK